MKTRTRVLSAEERQVLLATTLHPGGKHLTNSEIAARLGISVTRVKSLIHQACLKLGADNRYKAILNAMHSGEITLDEFYSLDDLAEVWASFGPQMLRRVAHLMRADPDLNELKLEEEQLVCTRRGADGVLTDGERDVLRLCWRGLTHAEIAERLCMSTNTVRCFLSRACAKLGARNRIDALVLALKRSELSICEITTLPEMLEFVRPLGPEAMEEMARILEDKAAREGRALPA